MAVKLELPTIQSWSCHSCGECCKQHSIEITEAERQRILDQNWTEADGIPADQPLFVKMGGPFRRWYRLAHQPDGSCAFLDENGLCRIHAKFGEAAKPLACRIYPFAFHPAGKTVRVSLRFSCPSVVANQGKPTSKRNRELRNIAKEIGADPGADPGDFQKSPGSGEPPPPKISLKEQVDWKDFERFLSALDAGISDASVPFLVRLLRTLHWVEMLREATFAALKGARIGEFLELITQAAAVEIPEEPPEPEPPSRIGRMQFRLLAGQYARKDTYAADRSLRGRFRMLRYLTRFARGKGLIPPMQEAFREVPFETVEQPFGRLPAEAEEIFTRYFRVKIQGLHFCGPAFYGWPLTDGFQALALVFPAVLYLARWLAASNDRGELTTDDVAQAMTIADHHHGYSPLFGSRPFRRRLRMLAATGDIPKLCVRYA